MAEAASESMETPVSNVVKIDEDRIRGHLDRIIRTSVEETLNGVLDAEAVRRGSKGSGGAQQGS